MAHTRRAVSVLSAVLLVAAATASLAQSASVPSGPATQSRPHGVRIDVEPSRLVVDDGDTVEIRWASDDMETVRILGIDCPETRHLEHDLPYGQALGEEARAFARGVFASASRITLLRAAMVDPYGRTLGYLFVGDRNYSILVIQARLSAESVTQFGDNGFPVEAAAVLSAAKSQGPLPFEPPHLFRRRMREVAAWMKAQGIYPKQ